MSELPPVYVDKTPFFGRVEEQKQFTAALQEMLNQPVTETLPYIFLLYGDGGIGKTTLAKRFRDIAAERPFRGKFQTLWIDWEDERRRYASLQVGRKNISPEVVFDVIHAAAVREPWGKRFEKYQKTIRVRAEAEKKAAEAVAAADERSELSALRGAGAGALAKLVRTTIPVVGDSGEKLVQAFLDAGIKVSAEQAAQLRDALETRLRAKLTPEQFTVFLNPTERLALALADGIQQIAAAQPLIIVLDTYEIVDRPDSWLRIVVHAAGPRVLWIISGRDDLVRNRLYSTDYFKGYPDEFPRRLYPYDMRQLALDDIRRYFGMCAPERPVNAADIEAISRATRGIPLAIRQAADIWQRDVSLADLVGGMTDRLPRAESLRKLTERYLQHVVSADADKQAIYALALARGNVEILCAMLHAEGMAICDSKVVLQRLERDYAFIQAERACLHDKPASFLLADLRTQMGHGEDRVKILNRRAVETLRFHLSKLEADLPLLEDRCADNNWCKATLDLTYHLFWLDEDEAWHWFVPRFVESLVYNRDLQRGLLRITKDWQYSLSSMSKRRLLLLHSGAAPLSRMASQFGPCQPFETLPQCGILLRPYASENPKPPEALLEELEHLERQDYLNGENKAERRAILNLLRGQLLYNRKQYVEALAQYEKAVRKLPAAGKTLKKYLANALYEVSHKFIRPESASAGLKASELAANLAPNNGNVLYNYAVALADSGHKHEAIEFYKKAIDIEECAGRYYNLGTVYADLGRTDDAIAAYHRAIELDPNDADPYYGLGNVYADLGRIRNAHAAYQRSIELDPKYDPPHTGLAQVYRDIRQYDKAITEYQLAIELDQDGQSCAIDYNGLGNVYRDLGHTAEALAAFQRAIELDPKYAYPHHALGNLYRDLNRTDEALAAFQRATELDPGFAEAYSNLADMLGDLGQVPMAVDLYETSFKIKPRGKPQNALGMLYQQQNALDKALAAYRTAVELEPNDGAYRGSLASVLKKLGRTAEAAEHEKIAREWITKDTEYNRACFEAICGNADKALALLKVALEKTPGDRLTARRDPDFESLRADPRFIALVGE